MNEIIEKDEIKVEEMIYEIRGKQVMLDSDLAKLYQCKNGTKDINKAVKRNNEKFPNDFYFQLTTEETTYLWFQTGTANRKSRTTPHVFTEQGVAMLATVLKTEVAAKVSINIMRALVAMRHYISNGLLTNNIEYKIIEHDNRISLLEKTFDSFKEKNNHIFFEGQVYDAYSLLLDILNKSKKEIIIIDNYAGKELLDILKELNKNITIISKNINEELNKNITIISKNINEELKKKYTSQYTNVKFINNNSFHDRFIIIDKSVLYHCGSSFKDLGKKCFGINRIDDNVIINNILNNLKEQL